MGLCLWVQPAVRCLANLDMCLPLLLLLPLLSRADQFYPAPTDQSEGTFTEWWSEFSLWRDETRDTLNLSLYSAPGLQWAATSFIQPQVEYFITGIRIFRNLRSSKNVTFRLCCMIGSCMTVSLANGLFHVSLKISRPGGFNCQTNLKCYRILPCRYGGVDSLLLWQGYPNIGLDDKNQFEMTASLPGGLAGLKDLVSQVSTF